MAKLDVSKERRDLKRVMIKALAVHSMCTVLEIVERAGDAGEAFDPAKFNEIVLAEIRRTLDVIDIADIHAECMDVIASIAGGGDIVLAELGGSSP